eukprot:Em0001g1300a
MPKTVEEAVILATQLEAIEAAQKMLCRQRTQESLAVERDTKSWDGEDSEESLAAAVKRTDNVPMVEKLRRQVEDSEKLVHQLKRQLQQLQLDQGHARQDAPARGFGHNVYTKKRFSNYSHKQQGAVCWNCGERGHLKRNCPSRKSFVDSAAVSSTLMIHGSLDGRVTTLLVDTGSAVTLVREDVWRDAKSGSAVQLESLVHTVVAVNGRKLNITGQCTIKIATSKKTCSLKKGLFSVHFVSSVSSAHSTPVCFVTLSETVTVPPNCQMCLPVKKTRHKSAPSADVLVVEPCEEFVHMYGLLVASSITAEQTMVQIMNPCFAPITVHADVRVEVLQPVVDCAQVQNSVSLAPSVKDRVAALLWRFEDVIALNDNDLGHTHLGSHRIDTADLASGYWQVEVNSRDREKMGFVTPCGLYQRGGAEDLAYLDFVLDTDASGDGLGGVLSQVSNGEERVLACTSRALSRTERKCRQCGRDEEVVEDAVSHLILPSWTDGRMYQVVGFVSTFNLYYLATWHHRGGPEPLETSIVQRPLQRVAMDILGSLPETPRDSLHTDQGKNFEAKIIKEICALLDIKKTRTTAYHPQSDGLVERFNRTLLAEGGPRKGYTPSPEAVILVPGQLAEPEEGLPDGPREPDGLEGDPPIQDPPNLAARDCNRDIPPPEDIQPVDIPPGPRRSARLRRPVVCYGDPVEIPETITDEDLFESEDTF